MAKSIPTSAVGLKAGSKAKAVGSIETYLEEFGYLESEDLHPRYVRVVPSSI
jgi:hypothetical protein